MSKSYNVQYVNITQRRTSIISVVAHTIVEH